MVCSHFLQSRDPKTGRMGCHMCRVSHVQAREGLEKDGSYSPRSRTEHTGPAAPSGTSTIFCLTCLLRTPCGNTVTGETIFDTKYECLKCGAFTPFTLAFKTES